MLATEIIDRKRDGLSLSRGEFRFMLSGFLGGSVPDYQMAAWAMAVLCRGLTDDETADLTDCMLESGGRLRPASERPRVDKHSTGGLGDKVSLVMAPLLALFDVDVPMLSGRGLGITGGTLDKLESFPGYRCDLSLDEIHKQLASIGCVITGTTPEIAPADRKLYALRDVTGTVPSIPLITASIMSKKLAESLDALVLDVKVGSGAFMQTLDAARQLARSLASTGVRLGLPTSVLVSDMNQPLGRMVGNACEVNEAMEILSVGAEMDDSSASSRARELSFRLASELLMQVRRFESTEDAMSAMQQAVNDGRAIEKFNALIVAQGGRFSLRLELARKHVIHARHGGWLQRVDGQQLGRAVIAAGGGRQVQGDAVDHTVGIEMLVQIGDTIVVGQPLIVVFCDSQARLDNARIYLDQALTIGEEPTSQLPLLYDLMETRKAGEPPVVDRG